MLLSQMFDDETFPGDDWTPDRLNDEASYICDSCGEQIVVPLDVCQGARQQYVEDCPVCCHPNVLIVEFDDSGNAEIRSHSE